MVNRAIRELIFESEITYRQVAAAIGISHEHLSRLLSKELNDRNRERILTAIEQVRTTRNA